MPRGSIAMTASEGLVVDAWDDRAGNQPVRFEVLSEMFLRREGGAAEPIAYDIDYDANPVRVRIWRGLGPGRVARCVSSAMNRLWQRELVKAGVTLGMVIICEAVCPW
jgi:hypothetical protein